MEEGGPSSRLWRGEPGLRGGGGGVVTFQGPSQTPDFKPTPLQRREATFHTPLPKCKTVAAGLLPSSADRPGLGEGAAGELAELICPQQPLLASYLPFSYRQHFYKKPLVIGPSARCVTSICVCLFPHLLIPVSTS